VETPHTKQQNPFYFIFFFLLDFKSFHYKQCALPCESGVFCLEPLPQPVNIRTWALVLAFGSHLLRSYDRRVWVALSVRAGGDARAVAAVLSWLGCGFGAVICSLCPQGHASVSFGWEKGENWNQEGCSEQFANCFNTYSPKPIEIKFQSPLRADIWSFGAGVEMPKLVLVSLKRGSLVHPAPAALLGVAAAPCGCGCGAPGPALWVVMHSVRRWSPPSEAMLMAVGAGTVDFILLRYEPGTSRFALAEGASAGWALGLLRGLALPSSSARVLNAKSRGVVWGYIYDSICAVLPNFLTFQLQKRVRNVLKVRATNFKRRWK